MIIHNGDHMEFEMEHANTPPEQRPDWPLPSFDARDWARAFCKIAKEQGHDLDEGWMVSWFANALMRGYDERAMSNPAEVMQRGAMLNSLLEQRNRAWEALQKILGWREIDRNTLGERLREIEDIARTGLVPYEETEAGKGSAPAHISEPTR